MSHLAYTVKGLTFDQKSVLLSDRKKLYWILQDLFLPHPVRVALTQKER